MTEEIKQKIRDSYIKGRIDGKLAAAETILTLIDNIESNDVGNTLESWKQYKRIRNAIRDKFMM